MLAALMIMLREGLEAALIVGIVLGALRQLGQAHRRKVVWAGVGAAVATSLAAGLGLGRLGIALEGRAEQLFEGLTMLVAAGVLTWMILWMQQQAREVKSGLEREVQQAIAVESKWMLFGLSYVAVVREGLESVLFLTAAAFGASPADTLIGGTLGLAIAIALGWTIYALGRRMNLRRFFQVSGLLLILFSAGLVSQGIHELQEAALLPMIIEQLWNINPVLNEKGTLGGILKALFGYNGDPSLLEVIGYLGYFPLLLVVRGLIGKRQHRVAPQGAQGGRS